MGIHDSDLVLRGARKARCRVYKLNTPQQFSLTAPVTILKPGFISDTVAIWCVEVLQSREPVVLTYVYCI